MEFTTVGTS